jgi:hypothetical protein
VTEPKSPLEQALDLVLYVPVGLAMTAREELPRLAEKGRERVTKQVTMARMIGQFAVTQGQREASKVVKQATDTLVALGVIPGDSKPGAVRAPASGSATEWSPATGNGSGRESSVSASPSSDGLAIPGYDSLSASQVVQRLAGLAPEELEAVRRYESATRGRRTILSKIAQLQSQS